MLHTALALAGEILGASAAGYLSGAATTGGKVSVMSAPLVYNKAAESNTARPYHKNTEALGRLAEYINKNQIGTNMGAQGVNRAEMSAQNVLNKIKAGEEPADSDINELVNVAVNDKNLIDQAIHNGLSQNPESQAYAIASRIEDKRYKNKLIFSNELKELVLSQFSMEENYNKENNTEPEIKFSVGYTVNNKPVAIIDNDILEGIPENQWEEKVKELLKK